MYKKQLQLSKSLNWKLWRFLECLGRKTSCLLCSSALAPLHFCLRTLLERRYSVRQTFDLTLFGFSYSNRCLAFAVLRISLVWCPSNSVSWVLLVMVSDLSNHSRLKFHFNRQKELQRQTHYKMQVIFSVCSSDLDWIFNEQVNELQLKQ